MMTLNKAKRLALEGLAPLRWHAGGQLFLIDEQTMCRRLGWIFFYEWRAAAGSCDSALAPTLMRNGPVVVTHAGAVHHLDGGRPIDEVLSELEVIVLARPTLQ